MVKQGLIDGSALQELAPILVDSQGRVILSSVVNPVTVGSITNPVTVGTLPSIPAGSNRIGSVGVEGWFNSRWAKAPIPFGAYTQYFEQFVGSGNAVTGTVVPSDTFRVITKANFWYSGTGSNLYIYAVSGNSIPLEHIIIPTSGQTYFWDGWIVLNPGDYVRWSISALSVTYSVAAWGFDYPNNL